MARGRSPARDKAREIWISSGGKITAKEIAQQTATSPQQVRKWKSLDKWRLEAEAAPKRGGQPGNKNAEMHGAPIGNKNAETHGAYATPHLADLTELQREYIKNITLDTAANMLAELQSLITKEADLQNKIIALHSADTADLYTDRIIEMHVPQDAKKKTTDANFKINIRTVIKASAFERAMKLEAELNKIHGRIIKLLDSIKGYELERRRIRLEERKYNLAKQKLAGKYDVNDETGEINDENDDFSSDIDV